MILIGNKLVLPLFGARLSNKNSYHLCKGVSVFNLSDLYEEKLRSQSELIARYEGKLKYMKSGLSIEPGKIETGGSIDWLQLIEIGIFVAMSIRLATGVPIDIPFWFDVEGGEIKGNGDTGIRTYSIIRPYRYSLDNDQKIAGLLALQEGFADILIKFIQEPHRNNLIRSLEFAAIGFQTRHAPLRLVNNTIFLESLFSFSNVEIAFQVASTISWYLKFDSTQEKRIELFSKIKELYSYRSKIVHGSDISSKNSNLMKILIFSESLNKSIFQKILVKRHVDVFSMKQSKRQEELKILSLGGESALLK